MFWTKKYGNKPAKKLRKICKVKYVLLSIGNNREAAKKVHF